MGILRVRLKLLKIAPLDDALYAVKSVYKHATHTMAMYMWSMYTLNSLIYGHSRNDCAIDEYCVVSETVLSESSKPCKPSIIRHAKIVVRVMSKN